MNKKKLIILFTTLGVVLCTVLLVLAFTRDNSTTTNTNEKTENNTINNTRDNLEDNDMVKTEEKHTESEKTIEEQPTEQTENKSSNQSTNANTTTNTNINTNTNTTTNTNINTNTNTNIHSNPVENKNDNSQENQGSSSTETKNPITPSAPEVEPEETVTNYGDVNGDSTINAKDLIFIKEYINGKRKFSETEILVADVNIDGVVDDVDTDVLAKYIAGGYNIELPYNSGKKYNITYELNGGKVSNNKTLRNVYALISDIETLPTLEKDEYAFIGWTGSNGNVPELTVTPKSDAGQNLHYVANWKLYGDVNEDGTINSKDTILVRQYIAKKQYFTQSQQLVADVNLDSVIDNGDVDILTKFITGGYGIDKLPYNP